MKSIGAAALAAPFMDLLAGRTARAAELGTARRLLIFATPNGTVPHRHWPTGTEMNWEFGANSAFEPLAPIKEDLLVLKGLDFYEATNHEGGMAAMLTGKGRIGDVGDGMSIDQFIAPTLSAGQRFPSLELGAWTSPWGGSVQTRMSYSGPGSYVTPDDNPSSVFQRMFGDVSASDADKAKLKARRLSVLDLVGDELTTLSGRLGANERIKLEGHLSAIQSVETALTATTAASCSTPASPPTLNVSDHANFPDIAKLQMDLGTLALACGMTSVVTLQMTHTVSPVAFTWLGINDGHHTLSHAADQDATGVENYIQCERWFAEQFLYLVERMKALDDPVGGKLFDNTLILWAQEMGDGRMHVCTDVPFIIAGSAGGFFRPGRLLDFGGTYHNRLLVSLANAVGVDIESFGDPGGGAGALEELR